MKPLATLCTLLLVLAGAVCAQTPDTTSAERYFPLEVGNVWEYNALSPVYGFGYERREVTGDTLVDGVRYFRYTSQWLDLDGGTGPFQSAYLRFDTLSTEIRRSAAGGWPHDILLDFPLGAPFGSEIDYDFSCTAVVGGGYGQTVRVGDDTVITSVKRIDTNGCEVYNAFAAGIGFVDFTTLEGSLVLYYARVGGVEYGEPFTTAGEEQPEATTGSLREPYPNPAVGTVTVPYDLAEAAAVRLDIVDLLGRTVAVLADGVRPAGSYEVGFNAGRLAAGVYLLRLVTSGGTATRRLVVAE